MNGSFDWGALMQAAARGQTPLVQFGCGPTTVALHARQPVYLATPYSKIVVDAQGQWSRPLSQRALADAAHEVGRLKSMGVSAFSPIVQSAAVVHGLADFGHHHPLDASGWLRWCQPFLNLCGAVVVPDLTGWAQSCGIKAEVAFAVGRGVPVFVYAGGDHGL